MKRSGNKGGGRGRSVKPAGRSGGRSGTSGRTGGKSSGRPSGRGFSSDRRREGDSREGADKGERKSRYGDEKPAFRPRTGDERGGEKRPYSSDRRREGGDSREGGERRSRSSDEKPPFRRTGDRPEGGSRYGGGEKRSYSSDRRREGGDSREGGERRSRSSDERPPFRRTGDRPEGGSRSRGGEKRSYTSDRRKEGGDSREGGERRTRSSDERPPFRRTGDRPEGGSRSRGGEKRGYSSDRRREGGDSREGGERRSRSSDERPPFRKTSSDRTESRERGKKFDGDKPFRKPFGERSEVGKRFGGDKRREEGDNTESTGDRRKKFGEDKDSKPAFRSRSTDGPRKRVDKGEKPEYENERGYDNKARSGKSKSKEIENEFNPGEPDFHSSGEIDQTRNFTESKPAKKEFTEKRSFDRAPKSNEKDDRQWNRKEKHEFYGDKKKAKSSAAFSKGVDDGSTRLNKYIANAGVCSRREADELIAAGVVSVNGEVITEMGYKVMPGDVVKYNNESLKSERLVYILLNKPKDFITTTDDPENRKTVMGLIEKACKERVYPVGRLDRNTTGVLLFTNDGDLAKKLTHPSFEVHKVYQVELDRSVKGTDMEEIREGVRLDDGTIKADEAVYTTPDKDVVGIELHSGKNRIVRRIFEHLGYEVKKLDRVVFAGLTKKDLPRGRWRFLTEMEVASLKMMTGKKAALR